MAIQRADMVFGDLLGAVGNSQLPGDLMIQIVSRLPVKSVLHFKSVCKAWYALFTSPMFIRHHCCMTSSFAKLNNLWSFCIHTNNYQWMRNRIFLFLVDRSCGERSFILLDPPFECDLGTIQVVGSAKGLVCLNFRHKPTFIVMWNPATRKHWQIPNPQLVLTSHEEDSVGFAYDEKTEIYKVIRILYATPSIRFMNLPAEGNNGIVGIEIRSSRVEVYSTATNTWRRIEDVDLPFHRITWGTVVSGFPYWYVVEFMKQGGLRKILMWFDPSVEAFRFHPLPNAELLSHGVGLSAIGEHPVVFCESFRKEKDETVLDIWKLNKCDDGGNDPICAEKLTIGFDSSLKLRTAFGFTRNGKVIALDESGALVICDPYSSESEIIHHRDATWGYRIKLCDYTESLVSPFIGLVDLC